eukprot:4637360-Pyramimonas_sp.AAC.1
MPDAIMRRLLAWFPALDPAKQLAREPPSGPRRDAENTQGRLLARARAWAAHWLPDLILRD